MTSKKEGQGFEHTHEKRVRPIYLMASRKRSKVFPSDECVNNVYHMKSRNRMELIHFRTSEKGAGL